MGLNNWLTQILKAFIYSKKLNYKNSRFLRDINLHYLLEM